MNHLAHLLHDAAVEVSQFSQFHVLLLVQLSARFLGASDVAGHLGHLTCCAILLGLLIVQLAHQIADLREISLVTEQ